MGLAHDGDRTDLALAKHVELDGGSDRPAEPLHDGLVVALPCRVATYRNKQVLGGEPGKVGAAASLSLDDAASSSSRLL